MLLAIIFDGIGRCIGVSCPFVVRTMPCTAPNGYGARNPYGQSPHASNGVQEGPKAGSCFAPCANLIEYSSH